MMNHVRRLSTSPGTRNQLVEDLSRLVMGASIVLRSSAKAQYDEGTRIVSNVIQNNTPYASQPPSMDTVTSTSTSTDSAFNTSVTRVEEKVVEAVVVAPMPAPTAAKTVEPVVPAATPESVSQQLSTPQFTPFPKSDVLQNVVIPEKKFQPNERAVPASPLSRALGFAGLGLNMALGTVKDMAKNAVSGSSKPAAASKKKDDHVIHNFISESNAERLAAGLCRMRGAALKVGQMLSIQDESLIPPQFQEILQRVRDSADVMPRKQLEQVLEEELGSDWQSKMKEFDFQPIAAASIGQVHRAVLHDGTRVVMKVQYPGVARSIKSDLGNLKRLMQIIDVFPKGLYLDEAMKNAEEELTLECDYKREAANQERFRELLKDETGVFVPPVIKELSSSRILTTVQVEGVPIDKLSEYQGLPGFDQAARNSVAFRLLHLTLRELYEFRFMQTDPNWSNFLFDPKTGVLNLIDFGAAREYDPKFVDEYLRMVYACAKQDREGILDSSRKLGFLTGDESRTMLDAHVQAAIIVGEPFAFKGSYDFVKGNIPDRVSKLAGVMVRTRLTPPPQEAYSLHRKLSGAFLTCKKLNACIPCSETFDYFYTSHKFTT